MVSGREAREAKDADRECDGDDGADEHEDDDELLLLLLPLPSEEAMLPRLARLWAAGGAASKPLEEQDSSSLSNASCGVCIAREGERGT